ncbi:MAG: hypothetical protein OEY48_06265 [Gammaproteobacteria bacterium]|nr:hypothetical protein [Gammaproteobacteria bacterium]MDH5592437.1 hypothetical protein [Gammaproteobacteria bacterium]
MKLRERFGFWLVVFLVLLAILFVVPVASKSTLVETLDNWFSENAEEEHQMDDDAEIVDQSGNMLVRIDDEISDYVGIETLALVETHFSPESKALAKVVDLKPLLVLQARHNKALASLNVAKVVEQSALEELKRLKSLAKGTGSVAVKNVNYAQASWREASAALQGLNFELQAVKDEAIQSWGETVAGWLLATDSEQWQRLLTHQESLLLVVLPVGLSMSPKVDVIRIARDGDRQQGRKAYFVSPALSTDQIIQGETYYFKTDNGNLRAGMRLDAWLPQGDDELTGVFVPEQAVVWYAGHRWAYVQVDEDIYQRRSLQSGLTAVGGLFMQNSINVGDELVINGAQMLLSEEFRWQIQDEDDDD